MGKLILNGIEYVSGGSGGSANSVINVKVNGESVVNENHEAEFDVPESLNDLDNVILTDITNGDFLVYNSENSKWVNKSVGISAYATAIRLWQGDEKGTFTIFVPDISKYCIVAYAFGTSDEKGIRLSIGTPRYGGSCYGAYNSNDISMLAHNFSISGNNLSCTQYTRGIYFNGNTTFTGDPKCHLRAVYGIVQKDKEWDKATGMIKEAISITSAVIDDNFHETITVEQVTT